jgi:hypothetical protein
VLDAGGRFGNYSERWDTAARLRRGLGSKRTLSVFQSRTALHRSTGKPRLGARYFVALASQALKRSPRLQFTGNDGKACKTREARVAIGNGETHLRRP